MKGHGYNQVSQRSIRLPATIGGLILLLISLSVSVEWQQLSRINSNLKKLFAEEEFLVANFAKAREPGELDIDSVSLNTLRETAKESGVTDVQFAPRYRTKGARVQEASHLVARSTKGLLQKQEESQGRILALLVGTLILVAAALLTYARVITHSLRSGSTQHDVRGRSEDPVVEPAAVASVAPLSDSAAQTITMLQQELRYAGESLCQSININVGFRSTVVQSPVGIVILNDNLMIDYANKAILGYFDADSSTALAGAPLASILQVPALTTADGQIKLTAGSKDIEAALLIPGKASVPVELSITTIKGGSKFVLNLIDVSHRAEVLRVRKDILAEVSHDLKTPLTSLRLFLSMILEGSFGQVPERVVDAISRVLPEVDRLVRLTQNMLSAESIDNGSVKLKTAPANLQHLIQTAVNAMEGAARAKRQSLSVDISENDRATECLIDEEKIVQVLVNLLSNAIKFSPRDTTVSVRATSSNEEVLIEIKDEGPGISAQMQSRIFNKFERAGNLEVGAGIGLWVSKRIMELHGGNIGVHNKVEGRGSVFWLSIPLYGGMHPAQPVAGSDDE